MALPAGIAPATVSVEASRANLLRHGSVSCDLKKIRPRAMEPHSNLPLAEGLPSVREMARRRRLDAGSGRKWMPHLESHQDLRFQRPSCYCCTTGQMLRMAAKVAWPDYPKAIEPRFIGDELFRWDRLRTWRGAESPNHFLGCIGIESARVGIFCIHRRKCHLADAVAPTPGWSGRIFVFEAGRSRYRLVLDSMDDLLV
jgi:hypothetical protein